MTFPLPCTVTAPNGDTYKTILLGMFQHSDSDGSHPLAIVKFRNGKIGSAIMSSITLDPVTHFHTSEGLKVEIKG
jgi:hypothetical protein